MRLIVTLFLIFPFLLSAQGRIYKDTVFNLAFGTNGTFLGSRYLDFGDYSRQDRDCPDDGMYAFVPSSPGCFSNGWTVMKEDRTPGDVGGNFMLVNAAYDPGDFLSIPLRQLKPNTNYELSFWCANILQETQHCEPLQPNIELLVENRNGKLLTYSKTGVIPWKQNPLWRRYSIQFAIGNASEPLVIRFRNSQTGGCGNDFVLDDILLVEWEEYLPEPIPVIDPLPKTKPTKKPAKPQVKPVQKVKLNQADTLKKSPPEVKAKKLYVPRPINNRRDVLVQSVELPGGTIEVCYYDDSKIDGDTISVYDNGERILDKVGLSKKPNCKKFKLNEEEPLHEIITVAETQGTMPPNTALLEVIYQGKRLNFFLHSDENQNARMQFKWKKP